LVMLLI